MSCVRHGVTELNLRGVFSGSGGEGITPDQRAALGGVVFDPTVFDAVYSSPAVRCLETAAALGVSTYLVDPRLAERHFGIFDGLPVEECRDRYPEEFEAFKRLDADFAIPGGESRAQHLARTVDWLREVGVHARVLAFTHGGTIDFLHRLGSGHPLHGGDQVFAGPNAAISEFDVSWPRVSMVRHGVPLAPATWP